jgi:CheY-like chemotaxis protein
MTANASAAGPSVIRVLLVEDDAFAMSCLTEMLQAIQQSSKRFNLPPLPLEIECATSGEAAWSLLRSRPFHLALVDLDLPGITGLDLSWCYYESSLHAKGNGNSASDPEPRTAMIACTSADVPMERLLEAGMQDILRKPARMPALRHLLQKWIPAQPSPGIELLPPPLRRGSSTLGAFAARVLHVEPCPITASNTQCLMQQLGVWVDSVETGEQAMRHLDKSGRRGDGPSSPRRVYDLVLVEMALPGMSGYALASWYRDLCAREDDGRPRADVAALTAEPDATLCAEFGIDFCLPKPLTADMCARVLCEWIKERNERLSALGKRAGSPCGDDADSFRTASSKEDSGNDLPILEWGSDSIKSRAG